MTKFMALAPLVILAAALPCNARSAEPSAPSIRLHMMSGRPVVEDVFLNGQGPFRFLLDTGAESNQFDAALARKLGLEASFQVELDTAAGTTRVKGANVGHVRLGTAELSDQEFLFTTLDGVHQLSPGIQGVLGQEFLRRFDYLLDFRRRNLIFGAAPPEGIRTALRHIRHLPAIETSEGTLVLDSGTDTTILCREATGKAGLALRTASGSAAVSAVVENLRLRVGAREYRPALAALAAHSAVGADGLLPASLFHGVYVSNSGGFVILD